jgi:hypothetical protein
MLLSLSALVGGKPMRRLWPLLLSVLFISIGYAEDRPEPIRVCVSTLENSSRDIVNPTWQRNELIKALERTNKSKEVKKGKAARIEAVGLESTSGPDSDVREKNCRFVLYTNLTEVLRAGVPQVSLPPPGAVEVGTRIGDPRAYPPDYHSATVEYRIMRGGNPEAWASGLVSAQEQLPEDTLVSQLMDQIAGRVASELRKPHPTAPQ